jgi:hypothetical protein
MHHFSAILSYWLEEETSLCPNSMEFFEICKNITKITFKFRKTITYIIYLVLIYNCQLN